MLTIHLSSHSISAAITGSIVGFNLSCFDSWHVLVLEGGFTSYDRFVDLPLSTGEGMLMSWKHSGLSIESGTRLFSKADREAAGQYVVRSATSAEKIHYDPATDTVVWTAAPKGFHKGKAQTFKGHEFVDQLGAHLPPGT